MCIQANVVIVSSEQGRASALHGYMYPFSLPSRLPHNTEHSSLCHTIGPCWLSILNIAVLDASSFLRESSMPCSVPSNIS